MKKFIFYLGCTLPTSLISLLICYILLYYFSSSGLSQMAALMLLLVTPIIIFLNTIITGYQVLKMQSNTAIQNNLVLDKKWFSFLYLVLFSITSFIIIEYLYYSFLDNQISHLVSSKLNEVLIQRQSSSSTEKFGKLPFIASNFLNYVFFILGILAINNRLYKKVLKSSK